MECELEYDHNFVRFLIEPSDRDATNFHCKTSDIKKYILDQICINRGKQPCPRFGGDCVDSNEGAIIINPHVDTVSWLEKVIKSYQGTALRLTKFKDSPQYTTKVKGLVPYQGIQVPVVKMLELLQAQNAGLQTDTWKVLNCVGKLVTFLIDDAGRQVLEENGFKLFFGFTIVEFELLERVKRCEYTGKIVPDQDIEAQLEEIDIPLKISPLKFL